MPLRGKNARNSKGIKIHKARHKQPRHHYQCYQEVEHRDDSSQVSYTSAKRSDHNEENDNICNKNKGTDVTLVNSFSYSEFDEKTSSMVEQKKEDEKSTTLTKDEHYYAILALIHKAVTSINNSPSLGSILGDANKRGMPLDAVIELYKMERLKAISLQGSNETTNASSKVSSMVLDGEGGKEVNQHETPQDDTKHVTPILPDIQEKKGRHNHFCSTESLDKDSECVDQEIATKGNSNIPLMVTSLESFAYSSTMKECQAVISGNAAPCVYPEESFPSGSAMDLCHDDDSANAQITLKVSSEGVKETESIIRERRPDPPGYSNKDEKHLDPPGLSLNDSRDIDSLSGSSTSLEHHNVFDNSVEIVFKEKSKGAVTCRSRSFGLEQNPSYTGRFKDGDDEDAELYDKHPDPPGQSYSLTIDTDVMKSATWSSSSMPQEHDHEAFVDELNSFELKEGNKYKDEHDNETSQSDDDVSSSEIDSSTIHEFVGERKENGEDSSKDDEQNEKVDNGEMRPDTSRISTSSPSKSDDGVEIILSDCFLELKGAKPNMKYPDDVGSYQYFNAPESHMKNSEIADENFVIDCVELRNDDFHNVEGVHDACELELPQLAPSSSSQDYNEAGAECVTSPKAPQQRNSTQQNHDTHGDDVEFVLEDSIDDSFDDEDDTSQSSGAKSAQGENNDEEISTLSNDSEVIRGKSCEETNQLGEGANKELRLDMEQHASHSTCDPHHEITRSCFGSSATHEHQDDFDNGIEIVLGESPCVETDQPSCCDNEGMSPSFSALTPKEQVVGIDISTLDLDNMKLWRAISNDTEGSENGDQNDRFDLLVQASSSTTDSDQGDSHSCTVSSTSEKLQDNVSTADEFNDDMLELSRIFSQATALVNEGIGMSESVESLGMQPSGSRSSVASFPAHEEQYELHCMNDDSSSYLDDSKNSAEKEHELIETDAIPQSSARDEVEENVDSQRMTENSAAVDAFFSRFSIQTDEEPLYVECNELSECKDRVETGGGENCENGNAMNRRGEVKSKDVRGTRNTVNGAEIAKTTGHLPQSTEVDSYLPTHLGLWKSPWQKTKRRYLNITHCDTTKTISSSESVNRKKYLMGHSGYSNIDFYSLYEASLVNAEEEEIDQAPWECRDVGQRFLHEKSVESRNWFGSFELIRGNDRLQYPVCCPKSVEVSVTRIPEEGEWSEDWFTTWKSRKDNPNNLESFAQDEKENMINDSCREKDHIIVGKNIVVEIGSLCPVRLRPGERITRIHPEFTSSLRQSRWRKKYIKGHLFSSV